MKSKLNMTESALLNLHFSFAFITFLLAVFLYFSSSNVHIIVSNYVAAYFIFVSNEIVESYLSVKRLFNKYSLMIWIRIILFLKPILLIVLLYHYSIDLDNAQSIFFYEFTLIYSLIAIYLAAKLSCVQNIISAIRLFLNHRDAIGTTWLTSFSKIAYDAFPNYFLSFYVSDIQYVQYNIARKIYGLINVGENSVIQVFNTLSIELRNQFKQYLFRYYSLIFSANIVGFVILVFFGKQIIEILTEATYATDYTLTIVLIMVSIGVLYFLSYPLKQVYILDNKLFFLNKSMILSLIFLVICAIIFIPKYDVYMAAALQALGLLLPIIITILFLPKSDRNSLINKYL